MQEMRHNLKATSAGIHVEQGIGRDAIPIRVDRYIPSDASEAAIPHASHNVRAINGSGQHSRIFPDALIEGIGIEQDAVEE